MSNLDTQILIGQARALSSRVAFGFDLPSPCKDFLARVYYAVLAHPLCFLLALTFTSTFASCVAARYLYGLYQGKPAEFSTKEFSSKDVTVIIAVKDGDSNQHIAKLATSILPQKPGAFTFITKPENACELMVTLKEERLDFPGKMDISIRDNPAAAIEDFEAPKNDLETNIGLWLLDTSFLWTDQNEAVFSWVVKPIAKHPKAKVIVHFRLDPLTAGPYVDTMPPLRGNEVLIYGGNSSAGVPSYEDDVPNEDGIPTGDEATNEGVNPTSNDVPNEGVPTDDDVANDGANPASDNGPNEGGIPSNADVANEGVNAASNNGPNDGGIPTDDDAANVGANPTNNDAPNEGGIPTNAAVANDGGNPTSNDVANEGQNPTSNDVPNEAPTGDNVANEGENPTSDDVMIEGANPTGNDVPRGIPTVDGVSTDAGNSNSNDAPIDIPAGNDVTNGRENPTSNDVQNGIPTGDDVTNEAGNSNSNGAPMDIPAGNDVTNERENQTTNEVPNGMPTSNNVPNRGEIPTNVNVATGNGVSTESGVLNGGQLPNDEQGSGQEGVSNPEEPQTILNEPIEVSTGRDASPAVAGGHRRPSNAASDASVPSRVFSEANPTAQGQRSDSESDPSPSGSPERRAISEPTPNAQSDSTPPNPTVISGVEGLPESGQDTAPNKQSIPEKPSFMAVVRRLIGLGISGTGSESNQTSVAGTDLKREDANPVEEEVRTQPETEVLSDSTPPNQTATFEDEGLPESDQHIGADKHPNPEKPGFMAIVRWLTGLENSGVGSASSGTSVSVASLKGEDGNTGEGEVRMQQETAVLRSTAAQSIQPQFLPNMICRRASVGDKVTPQPETTVLNGIVTHSFPPQFLPNKLFRRASIGDAKDSLNVLVASARQASNGASCFSTSVPNDPARPAPPSVNPIAPSGFSSAAGRRPGAPANYEFPRDRESSRWTHVGGAWTPRSRQNVTADPERGGGDPDDPEEPETGTAEWKMPSWGPWIWALLAALVVLVTVRVEIQNGSLVLGFRTWVKHVFNFLIQHGVFVLPLVGVIVYGLVTGGIQRAIIRERPVLNKEFFIKTAVVVLLLGGMALGAYVKSSKSISWIYRPFAAFNNHVIQNPMTRRSGITVENEATYKLLLIRWGIPMVLLASFGFLVWNFIETGAYKKFNPRGITFDRESVKKTGFILLLLGGQALGAYIKSAKSISWLLKPFSVIHRHVVQPPLTRRSEFTGEIEATLKLQLIRWAIAFVVIILFLFLLRNFINTGAYKKFIPDRRPSFDYEFFKKTGLIFLLLGGQALGAYIKSSKSISWIDRPFAAFDTHVRKSPLTRRSETGEIEETLKLQLIQYFIALAVISSFIFLLQNFIRTGAYKKFIPSRRPTLDWEFVKKTGVILLLLGGQALGAYIKNQERSPLGDRLRGAYSTLARRTDTGAKVYGASEKWSLSTLFFLFCAVLAAGYLVKWVWSVLQKRYPSLQLPAELQAKIDQAVQDSTPWLWAWAVAEFTVILFLASAAGRELNLWSRRNVSAVLLPKHLVHKQVSPSDERWHFRLLQTVVLTFLCTGAYAFVRNIIRPPLIKCYNALLASSAGFERFQRFLRSLALETSASQGLPEHHLGADRILGRSGTAIDQLWTTPLSVAKTFATVIPKKALHASPMWAQNLFMTYPFIIIVTLTFAEIPLTRLVIFIVLCWYKNYLSWEERARLDGVAGGERVQREAEVV